MSELKADKTFVFGEECEAYKKYEADKVIAEKDKEIAKLKSDIADLRDDKKLTDAILDERNAEIEEKDAKILALDAEVFKQKHHAKLFFDERNYAETQLRHQKYKRCLDKANYWVAVSYQCVDDKHRQRAEKHNYKWLEFAKNFKEAKL